MPNKVKFLNHNSYGSVDENVHIRRFERLIKGMSEGQIRSLLDGLESLVFSANERDFYAEQVCSSSIDKKITSRETEILVLIANGYTRRDISNSLGISTNTAASHINNLYQKLAISSVAEATQIAVREGLLQSDTLHT